MTRRASDKVRRGRAVATLVKLGWRPPPLTNAQATRLLEDIANAGNHGKTLELTTKERSLLQLAASGSTAEHTAEVLGVGTETVKTRTKLVRRKLGARSTTHAVAIAMREGLIR